MRWLDPPPTFPADLHDLHPLVTQMLARRGITTPLSVRAFLDPAVYSPAPPTDLPGLAAVAKRVEKAIKAHETICVWGDFDVDGQTSTTILFSTIQALGGDVRYHIPVRAQESHGVNIPVLKDIIDRGAHLILTCDTGISAHEALAYALSRRVDVLVTDHHDLPDTLPPAFAITNPKLLPPNHPLAGLSGSGLAFMLAEELLSKFSAPSIHPDSLLDLAALGLVADLARLTGDSRYLVQRGLQVLRQTQRLGLKVMMEMADLNPGQLTEEHIGYTLGPRLNALGRLGDANPAVELLTTSDAGRARLIATQLEGLNAQRQLLTAQVTEAAEKQLCDDPALLAQPVLVLDGAAWPGGIVGIAASRLVERYHRPAILLCGPPEGLIHGSARSIEGINITAAIAAQKDLLLNFGGHPMAAGLSLKPGMLQKFRKRLAKTIEKMTVAVDLEPSLQIDAWINLPEADMKLAEVLEQLAPFGPGNEKLVLASRDLITQKEKTTKIGRNKEHVKFSVTDGSGASQTILWWSGADEPLPEGRFDLAFTLRASDWRGKRQAQLEFVDFRVLETKPVEIQVPQVEILDQRMANNSEAVLKSLPKSVLVWAEGEDKKTIDGQDRNHLVRSEGLAIWTPPPWPEVLSSVLEKVQPQKVILFAVPPSTDEPRVFLERLAGLIKFAIRSKGGRTTVEELAAATAQREVTVRLGLEWMSAKGQIVFKFDGNALQVMGENQAATPYAVADLENGLKTALDETHAYRLHFVHANKESLIFLKKTV